MVDSATILLIHADGADATTVFSDAAGKTVTTNGNAQVDTAQSKFGGSSALFDGSGDYLALGGQSDFAFGTGDFTIDFWVRFNSLAVSNALYDARPASTDGAYPRIYTVGTQLRYHANSADRITGGTTLSTGTWYHVALVRSGTDTKLFLNGTQEGSTYTSDSTNYLSGTDRPYIGRNGVTEGDNFNGWLDEYRVSKGTARWTANFTPPTQAYAGGLVMTGNVFFASTLAITGTLSKGSGTFLIDHPLAPRTKLLYHSFVESPDVKNMYDGIAELDENGAATIMLPLYFEALNKDFRYQYLPLGEPMPKLTIGEEIKNNQFTIVGGAPHGRVSWQVTGIRHDPFIIANPIINEIPKTQATVVGPGECIFEPLCR